MTTLATNPSFVVVAPGGGSGGFSAAECEQALQLAVGAEPERAEVGAVDRSAGGHVHGDVRRAVLHRVRRTGDSTWLFDRVVGLATAVSQAVWGFDLDGEVEQVQLVRYGEGDHYGWHADWGASGETSRKVSVTVQLSDEASYSGGDLVLYAHDGPRAAGRGRGAAVVFPSFVLHRVQPVTGGVRWALVAWLTGPRFR